MSAKVGAITTRIPYCNNAHTACSRLDPHPKFRLARRTDPSWYRRSFSTKSFRGILEEIGFPISPSSSNRHASNRLSPNPVFLIDFKNCLGMIWSVSTFARSSGMTKPECVLNFCAKLQLLTRSDVHLRYDLRLHSRQHSVDSLDGYVLGALVDLQNSDLKLKHTVHLDKVDRYSSPNT